MQNWTGHYGEGIKQDAAPRVFLTYKEDIVLAAESHDVARSVCIGNRPLQEARQYCTQTPIRFRDFHYSAQMTVVADFLDVEEVAKAYLSTRYSSPSHFSTACVVGPKVFRK